MVSNFKVSSTRNLNVLQIKVYFDCDDKIFLVEVLTKRLVYLYHSKYNKDLRFCKHIYIHIF